MPIGITNQELESVGAYRLDPNKTTTPSLVPLCVAPYSISPDGLELTLSEQGDLTKAKPWLEFLLNYVILPSGSNCTGEVFAQGDDQGDLWSIRVEKNQAVYFYLSDDEHLETTEQDSEEDVWIKTHKIQDLIDVYIRTLEELPKGVKLPPEKVISMMKSIQNRLNSIALSGESSDEEEAIYNDVPF